MAPDPDDDAGPVERPSDWLPPAPPALPPTRTPMAQPPAQPPAQNAYPRPPFPQTPLRPKRVNGCLVALAAIPILALALTLLAFGAVLTHRSSGPSPTPPRRSTSTLPERPARVDWTLTAAQVRPGLAGARFVPSPDGSFSGHYLAAIGGRWLTITGTDDATDTVLHAIDPATGRQQWQRALDGALCATEAPASGLLCASVITRDTRTQLGVRWRLHLLDPATGADRRTRDIDGWLTAVHWAKGSFVIIEQRQPAPHAVLSAYGDTDLRPRWNVDLRNRPGQAEMFTTDRIIARPEPDRPGLALDRPRIRDVGNGLVALWAGGRTAFVDNVTGELIMMPHCSRLVDDAVRLWCNETDGATSYSYSGAKLARVRGPRLAFPTDDGVGVDRGRPVFIDSDGAGVSVNPRTGAVGARYTPPGRGTAFGLVTMPNLHQVGGHTFLVGRAGTLLIDPKADRVLWRNPDITSTDLPVLSGKTVYLGSYRLDQLDLTTGAATSRITVGGGSVVALGGSAGSGAARIAGEDAGEIRLLRL